MHFSLSIVPVFAVSLAQGLIIPTYISNVPNDLIRSLSRQDVSEIKRVVQVEYPTGILTKSDSHSDQSGSLLELNFTIQHKNIDHLMLNNIVIYPSNLDLRSVESKSLLAPHLIKSSENNWEYVSAAKLGYLVSIENPRKSKEKFEQITVQVDIFEETGTPFHTTQIIELQLSKPFGKLVIQAPESSILKTHEYSGSPDVVECNQILCTVKSGITKALARAKGALKSCHKMIHSHLFHNHKSSNFPPRQHEQKLQLNPEHSNPLSHPEKTFHYHFRQRKHSVLRNTILPNIIPTLLGIVAGISAAIIGILLGHFAIYVWSSLCRRNSNKYISIEQSDTTDPENDGSNYHQIDSPLEDLIASTNEKMS